MVQCAIKGCSSRSDVHSNLPNKIHFHRIPKDNDLREKWKEALNNYNLSNAARICSKHFKIENYYTTSTGILKLAKKSVPDINLIIKKSPANFSDFNAGATSLRNTKQPEVQQFPKPIKIEAIEQTDSGEIKTEDVVDVEMNTPNLEQIAKTKCHVYPRTPQKQTVSERKKEKIKLKTPLERKLYNEVKKLRELNKNKQEAIDCLEEQNRRLLSRNNVLQEALDRYEKVSFSM